MYGEQIGATLVQAAKIRPLAVFTDCAPALAAVGHIDVPLWLVLPPAIDATVDRAPRRSRPLPVALTRRLGWLRAVPLTAGMRMPRA